MLKFEPKIGGLLAYQGESPIGFIAHDSFSQFGHDKIEPEDYELIEQKIQEEITRKTRLALSPAADSDMHY